MWLKLIIKSKGNWSLFVKPGNIQYVNHFLLPRFVLYAHKCPPCYQEHNWHLSSDGGIVCVIG